MIIICVNLFSLIKNGCKMYIAKPSQNFIIGLDNHIQVTSNVNVWSTVVSTTVHLYSTPFRLRSTCTFSVLSTYLELYCPSICISVTASRFVFTGKVWPSLYHLTVGVGLPSFDVQTTITSVFSTTESEGTPVSVNPVASTILKQYKVSGKLFLVNQLIFTKYENI